MLPCDLTCKQASILIMILTKSEVSNIILELKIANLNDLEVGMHSWPMIGKASTPAVVLTK